MFTAIQAENRAKEKSQEAAQLAREAEKKAGTAWRDAIAPRDPLLRKTWNETKAASKAAHALPRRQTGPATQHRIKMSLSSALEDARKRRMITDNWAALVRTPRIPKAKALEWTASRVEAWRNTGKKPSPVMVWTPEQTGTFLDSVVYDRLYVLWVIIAFLGLRRGEACALPWSEVDLDAGVIHITEEIVTVAYEPHSDTPKSDNIRDIALDEDTIALLRWWRGCQEAEKNEWLETDGRMDRKTAGFSPLRTVRSTTRSTSPTASNASTRGLTCRRSDFMTYGTAQRHSPCALVSPWSPSSAGWGTPRSASPRTSTPPSWQRSSARPPKRPSPSCLAHASA